MPTVGQDTFVEAVDTALTAHTPDVGAAWSVEAAQFTVIAATNDLQHNTTVLHMARKGDDIGAAAMDVTANCKTNVGGSRLAGVCGRMTTADFDNAYQAYVLGDGAAVDVFLFKEVGGTRTQLGTWDANLASTDPVELKLQIRTADKKVFVAGVERISSADDVLTGNQYAGVIMNGNAAAAVRVDDFLSADVAAAAAELGAQVITSLLPVQLYGAGLVHA